MYVIIVGQGKLGASLTKQISKELSSDGDIVVVDPNPLVVGSIVDKYDVMGICGDGVNVDILREAGAEKANLLIACTDSDELNILCCTFAKNLGTEKTIARVRNPHYHTQMVFLRDKIGISMIVNPEFETANEIEKIIRFPQAAKLDTFAESKVELAGVVLQEGNPLCNMKVCDIKAKYDSEILICAVQRGDRVFIPTGESILEKDDTISLTGSRNAITMFLAKTKIYKRKINNIIIVGGGRIGYYLSQKLSETGRNVTIIDSNEQRCRELTSTLEEVTVIHGDGTDPAILEEQNIGSTDALIALTGIDEENIILSLVAKNMGVGKVIAKVDRHSYTALGDMGLETLVSPIEVASGTIIQYVRALNNSAKSDVIQTLYKLVGGRVEAAEFIIPEDWIHSGEQFKDLNFRKNLIIGCITRNGKIIFPRGDDFLQGGDRVIVVTTGNSLKELNDIFREV